MEEQVRKGAERGKGEGEGGRERELDTCGEWSIVDGGY